MGAVGPDAGPVPPSVVAVTVNVYAVPFVNPVTVSVVSADMNVVTDCALAPINGVTVYDVMGSPPRLAGAVHDKVTWESPATPLTPLGAEGTAAGVMGTEGDEAGLVPPLVVAVTVKV
jgi:hypothetical protein